MILDSSAIVAIVQREPGFETLVACLEDAEHLAVGAPTLAEAAIVLERRLALDSRAVLERFLQTFQVGTVAFSPDHWREAARAFRRFGRGRHPAALNSATA